MENPNARVGRMEILKILLGSEEISDGVWNCKEFPEVSLIFRMSSILRKTGPVARARRGRGDAPGRRGWGAAEGRAGRAALGEGRREGGQRVACWRASMTWD